MDLENESLHLLDFSRNVLTLKSSGGWESSCVKSDMHNRRSSRSPDMPSAISKNFLASDSKLDSQLHHFHDPHCKFLLLASQRNCILHLLRFFCNNDTLVLDLQTRLLRIGQVVVVVARENVYGNYYSDVIFVLYSWNCDVGLTKTVAL
jgi:hypothetical protein